MEGVVLLTSYALSPIISGANCQQNWGARRWHLPARGREAPCGRPPAPPRCFTDPVLCVGTRGTEHHDAALALRLVLRLQARETKQCRTQERAASQPNAGREAWAQGRDRPRCSAALQTQQGVFPGPVQQGSVKNCSCFCS